jgi:hypothetical protein
MLYDGLEPQKMTVSDLHDFYWKVGSSVLFMDDLSSVESVFFDFAEPWHEDGTVSTGSKLAKRFDVISAQAILHVLSLDQCKAFLRNALASLKPSNGLFFGTCVGATTPSDWNVTPTRGLEGRAEAPRFLHNAETLRAALLESGFADAVVSLVSMQERVETQIASETKQGLASGASMARLVFSARS